MSQPISSENSLVTNNGAISQAVVNLDQDVIAVCLETGQLQMDVNSSIENSSQSTNSEEKMSQNNSHCIIVVCPKTGEVRQKTITNHESILRNNTFLQNSLKKYQSVVHLGSSVKPVCPEPEEVHILSDKKSDISDNSGRESCSDSDVVMDSDSLSLDDSSDDCEEVNSDSETAQKSCVELVTGTQASLAGLPPKILCTTCGESFRCADMFQTHKCIDLDKKTCCQLCDFEYVNNKQYHIHLKKHIDADSLQCPLCRKEFKKRPYLLVHLRSHSKHRLYECPHCSKEFIHFNQFKFHEHVHTGVKPYTCSFCDKMFARLSDRKRHEETHMPLSYTPNKDKQDIHPVIQQQPSTMKQYQCQKCGKTFSHFNNLQRHELIHASKEALTCSYCACIFPSHEELQCHEANHTHNTKPYNCNYCNKAFKQRSHLTDHERIHTDVKPLKCTHCSKAFVQQSHLKSHENSHARPCAQCSNSSWQHQAGVKVYKCKQCLKAFARYGSFKAHEKLHKNMKPLNLTESLSQKLQRTVKNLTEEENMLPTADELAHSPSDFDRRTFAEEMDASEKEYVNNEEPSVRQPSAEEQQQPKDLSEQNSSRKAPSPLEHSEESISLNAQQIKVGNTEYNSVYDAMHKSNNSSSNNQCSQIVLLKIKSFLSKNIHTDSTVSISQDEMRSQDYEEPSQHTSETHDEREVLQDSGVVSKQLVQRAVSTFQSFYGDHSLLQKHSSNECLQAGNSKLDEVGKLDNQTQGKCSNKTMEQQQTGCRKSASCRAKMNESLITRPYKCSFCNKAFIQRSHLRDHEYIHKGVKPFKCGFCEKTFTQSGNLKTHERIHTGSKPFACDYCDKAFIQRNHLREHVKVHLESKHKTPYKSV